MVNGLSGVAVGSGSSVAVAAATRVAFETVGGIGDAVGAAFGSVTRVVSGTSVACETERTGVLGSTVARTMVGVLVVADAHAVAKNAHARAKKEVHLKLNIH